MESGLESSRKRRQHTQKTRNEGESYFWLVRRLECRE
jgi:hypothetical protein